MNKTKTIFLTAAIAVVAGLGVTTLALINKPAQVASNQQAVQAQTLAAEAERNPNLVTFTGEAGKNVLDQLKTKATVEVKDSAYGPFVDSINGIVGGTDGKYWSFYVDGQMAQVGAGEYVTKGGEKVEWKFE